MDELISRQAAIDYFVTNVGFHDEDGYPIEDTDELRKIWTEYFSGIPSAEPHWIPVTEATPTEDDDYWCTFGAETGWFVDWCSWYQGRWTEWTNDTVSEVSNVIAWCKPMEPYKGVTE